MINLKLLINYLTNKKVYIQTHDFPDPDAIASAYGLQCLLLYYNIESTICYSGIIDRIATTRMLDIWNIKLNNLDDINNLEPDDVFILIDTQHGNINTLSLPITKYCCIDHHSSFKNGKSNYVFSDIRQDVGSCASIISEYFFNNNIPIPTEVSSALLYGIMIDTANLSRGTSDLDLDMYYLLYRKANRTDIKELTSNKLEFSDLQSYVNAISNIECVDNISFTNIGNNCPEALIAMISDFMLDLDKINFSIVYSIKEDGIKISIRNSNPHLDAGKITHLALKALGNGGGHRIMAGGFVPYNKTDNDDLSYIDPRITYGNCDSTCDSLTNNKTFNKLVTLNELVTLIKESFIASYKKELE